MKLLHRRCFTLGMLSLVGAGSVRRAVAETDQTAGLQRQIETATRAGRPLVLPAGTFRVAGLRLPDGAEVTGTRGATRLVLAGDGPLVIAESATRLTLRDLVFDGAGRPLGAERGLVELSDVSDLALTDCAIEASGGDGLRLRGCGGRVERTAVRNAAVGGIFTIDATGLAIADNLVERCGANGIQVWRTTAGDDGTQVVGNRVADIRAPGGTGQYGNGISVFRAGGVSVAGNTIRRCAFSAVRNNAGRDVTIAHNNCAELGETAIFAEFEFEGCVVSDNVIDGAVAGIQIVNFADHGGHAGVCAGNVIRNLRPTAAHTGHEWGYECGIKVEADVAVTGNLVEGAPWVGILVGWGASLRDVAVQGNVVRDAPIGIGVSVATGAGSAAIVGNLVSGASRGAIVGMEWDKPATGDLAAGAAAPAGITVSGNRRG